MMDIQKLRDGFEKLPEIAEKLKYLKWSDALECYVELVDRPVGLAAWVNGAWYAFQELQKIIDLLRKQAKCHHTWHGRSENQYCSQCGLT